MKAAFVFLFLVIAGVHLCSALPPTEYNCKWTGCEGKTRYGVDICNEYGAGRYTGRTAYDECSWDASRVECCQPLPAGTVKWTGKCYGMAYGGNYVCNSEYGPGFRTTGNKQECPGIAMTQWECTN